MRRVIFMLCILILSACSRQDAELLTGRGLDVDAHTIEHPADTFAPNEPFSILLRNARFQDSYVDLEISHKRSDGALVPVRSIILSNIAPDLDYIQIKDAFAIPYPGTYRIAFSQLTEVLAYTFVHIMDAGGE